jgi:single-strand DNA-binding protein
MWEDKDGNKRYTTEINATNVTFLNGNVDKNEALKDAGAKAATGNYEVKTDANFASEDIPF